MVSKKAVAKIEEKPIQFNAETLIAQAIDKNVPVETMEKLLAMRKELRAEQAKIDYDKAMASFQADCPTIVKTKEVKTRSGMVAYKYAPIDSIVEQVKDALKANDFSYSTDMELLDSGVKVCVKVTHIGGHNEVTCMSVPLGTKTDIMSQSQVVAAATTFAKRYAFCNAFGILTGDEDNDARPQDVKSEEPVKKIVKITEFQQKKIFALLKEKGKTNEDLHDYMLKAFKVEHLKDLEINQASKIIEVLTKMPDFQPDSNEEVIEGESVYPGAGGPGNDEEINLDEVDEGIAKMQS